MLLRYCLIQVSIIIVKHSLCLLYCVHVEKKAKINKRPPPLLVLSTPEYNSNLALLTKMLLMKKSLFSEK